MTFNLSTMMSHVDFVTKFGTAFIFVFIYIFFYIYFPLTCPLLRMPCPGRPVYADPHASIASGAVAAHTGTVASSIHVHGSLPYKYTHQVYIQTHII